ncbi:MAG: hypothetical protein QXR53_01800 [Candidatus Norongarragalinales archaeon]
MLDGFAAFAVFSIIDDIVNLITWSWWLWLFFLAWYFYKWAQDHLGFSPILALAVGGILIYFLVIEHPIIGTVSVFTWMLLMSGILFLLPMVTALFNTFFHHPPQMQQPQQGGFEQHGYT